MIKYDSAAQKILNECKAPYKGIIIDVVDYEDKPGILVLRLYKDNISDFNNDQQIEIATWLVKLLDKLNNLPLLCKYTYELSE